MHLRHAATRDVLACWFGVDRSIITWVIGEGAAPARRARLHHQPGFGVADPRGGVQLPDARTGTSSSPARAAERRQDHGRHGGDGRMLFSARSSTAVARMSPMPVS
ncbi:transposase family protein [Streptomyces parvulus]|uniref:transposase family protein n=1 Tax=Streptomyces parvulus TaxID=146923 RepID=UPI001C6889F1